MKIKTKIINNQTPKLAPGICKTVEPPKRVSFNDFNKNIIKQLKKIK